MTSRSGCAGVRLSRGEPLHYTTLHFITSLHYITLQYITSHCIILHYYIILHYIDHIRSNHINILYC